MGNSSKKEESCDEDESGLKAGIPTAPVASRRDGFPKIKTCEDQVY